eukprot:TRINITY_DN1628_c0_g4_i1.p1 TRINITY_DN1628_c0_g4~~TRINITY_DN1628_c0_g4_i1.p1  ORF type:complete len:176 (+),score=97.95 TRINITY_DN1628_c0_g4_i1:51-578(+)
MNKLFSVIVLLGLASTVLGGCLNPLATAEKRELSSCQWYNDKTCCTDQTVPNKDDATKAEEGCAEIKEGCADQAFLYACGAACSPDFSDYIDGTSIKICKKFANKFYSSCKDAEIKDESGSCKKIKDEYADGKEFAEKGLGATYVDGDSGCFNAAGLTQPLVALVAAAVAVARLF